MSIRGLRVILESKKCILRGLGKPFLELRVSEIVILESIMTISPLKDTCLEPDVILGNTNFLLRFPRTFKNLQR